MNIGIYAGSFCPFHRGHFDILVQSEKVFRKVIIGIGNNPEKHYEGREELPRIISDGREIIRYEGLLTDLIKNLQVKNPTNTYHLIRGLRNGHDLEYEQNQISFMRSMYINLNVVFFICNPIYQHISSTALRAIRKFSQEEYEKYIVK